MCDMDDPANCTSLHMGGMSAVTDTCAPPTPRASAAGLLQPTWETSREKGVAVAAPVVPVAGVVVADTPGAAGHALAATAGEGVAGPPAAAAGGCGRRPSSTSFVRRPAKGRQQFSNAASCRLCMLAGQVDTCIKRVVGM
jgi:hypothetical protein